MSWADVARRRHKAAEAALAQALPSYSVPIADSLYTAPGWRFLGEYYYTWKDVMYPWDPNVLRAIREIEPTVVPVTRRSIWQKMDRGNPQTPIVLIRHAVVRAIRDPIIPPHQFRIELPIHHEPGLWSSFPNIYTRIPGNWMELQHHSRDIRPYSPDLPGAYLGHDWDLNGMLHRDYENNRSWKEIVNDFHAPVEEEEERKEKFNQDENDYVDRQIARDFNEEASDLEWKEALLGDTKRPEKAPMVAVP